MKTKIYTSILAFACTVTLSAQGNGPMLDNFDGGGMGLGIKYANLDTAAIVANPDPSGINTSDNVLIYDRINDGSYDSLWGAIVYLTPDTIQGTQDFNRLYFKAYANNSGEFYVRIWSGGTQLVQNWAYPSQITADTWVQESLDLTGLNWNNIDSISLEFGDWVKVTDSTTSVTGDGWIAYIDDFELGYYIPPLDEDSSVRINIGYIDPLDAPPIDGLFDASWDFALDQNAIDNNVDSIGPETTVNDISGNFYAMWDANNVYIFVNITDDVPATYPGANPEKNDGIEIYTDGMAHNYDNGRVNNQQIQNRFNLGRAGYDVGDFAKADFGSDTIQFAIASDSGAWKIEMRIPLFYFMRPYAADSAAAVALVAAVQNGDSLGFEISILDADAVDTLDNILNWSNPTEINQSPTNSEYYGSLMLSASCKSTNCDPWSLKDNTNVMVKIYPNPTESYVTIEMINLNKIEIYSIDGRILIDQKAENGYATVDVSTLKSGMYLIKATNKNNQFTTAKFQKYE